MALSAAGHPRKEHHCVRLALPEREMLTAGNSVSMSSNPAVQVTSEQAHRSQTLWRRICPVSPELHTDLYQTKHAGTAAAGAVSPQSLPGLLCSGLSLLTLWRNKPGWFLVNCSMSSPEGNMELVRRRWQKLNFHFPESGLCTLQPSHTELAWPDTAPSLEMSQSVIAGAGHCCCRRAAASTSERWHFGMEIHICCLTVICPS